MAARFKVETYRHPHFIREWRRYRGLTQEQLAEKLGLTKGSISRVENGEVPYSQDLLEALSTALDTEPGSLLMRPPTESEALWLLWSKAQPAERKQLTEMARVIVKTGTRG